MRLSAAGRRSEVPMERRWRDEEKAKKIRTIQETESKDGRDEGGEVEEREREREREREKRSTGFQIRVSTLCRIG